jgi:hypothetical protein
LVEGCVMVDNLECSQHFITFDSEGSWIPAFMGVSTSHFLHRNWPSESYAQAKEALVSCTSIVGNYMVYGTKRSLRRLHSQTSSWLMRATRDLGGSGVELLMLGLLEQKLMGTITAKGPGPIGLGTHKKKGSTILDTFRMAV